MRNKLVSILVSCLVTVASGLRADERWIPESPYRPHLPQPQVHCRPILLRRTVVYFNHWTGQVVGYEVYYERAYRCDEYRNPPCHVCR